MKTSLKVTKIAIAIFFVGQAALAHPKETDSIRMLPNNFRIVVQSEVNIKPNTTYHSLNEDCRFTYKSSLDDRFISAGTTFVFEVSGVGSDNFWRASSSQGLTLSCRSNGWVKIGALRRGLSDEFNSEMYFPAPVPFQMTPGR